MNFVLISYYFNFLGESALRSLPTWTRPFVIHVCKTKHLADQFDYGEHEISGIVHIEEHRTHGSLIDKILASTYEKIAECDKLAFIDHDFWFSQEYFSSMLSTMSKALDGGSLVAAHGPELGRECRVFETRPMFMCKVLDRWPLSWCVVHGIHDTGQYLGSQLLCNGLITILEPFGYTDMHWTNDWWYLNTYAKNNPEDKFVVIRKAHYENLARSGLWFPSDTELEMMSEWTMLEPTREIFKKNRCKTRKT